MNASWNWPGSRWWRVDLHTHSPASYDFKPDAFETRYRRIMLPGGR